MPTLYGYGRGSTSDQEDTLTAQGDRVRLEYEVRFKGQYAWGGYFADKGVSGGKPLASRPAGFEVWRLLEEGDVLVITKLDRGFRSMMDFVQTVARLDERKVRLVVLDLAVDTGTTVGRLIGNVLASVAEFERHRLAERTRDAVAVRRREGRPVTGKSPYGFRIDRNGQRKRLVPDPEARATGARFLAWYEGGWSLDTIWRHLLKEKVYRRGTGGHARAEVAEWSRSTINRWIAEERRYRALEAQGVEVTARVALSLPRLDL